MANIRKQIDMELKEIVVTEHMREDIYKKAKDKTQKYFLRYVAAVFLVLILGTTTVAAVEYFSEMRVNEELLPELDKMQVAEIKKIEGTEDEYGSVSLDFSDYEQLKEILGIELLDTHLSVEHDYMIGEIKTNNEDYAMVKIENYIIGDTMNFRSAKGEPYYKFEYEGVPFTYDSGEEYYKTISLEISFILNEEQNAIGWNKDYLGMYEFVEQYISAQGYKVNIVESTMTEKSDIPENVQTQKCAVFVADGIRYELSGNVTIETMKEIVDSMEKQN